MNIAPITSLVSEVAAPEKTTAPFSQWMTNQITDTNDKLQAGEKALQSLARGETDNLHHVMIKLEQAKLSLQLLEQVRSRAFSAYQTLMKEQI